MHNTNELSSLGLIYYWYHPWNKILIFERIRHTRPINFLFVKKKTLILHALRRLARDPLYGIIHYTFLNTSKWARWTRSSMINEGMFSTYLTELNGEHDKVRVFVIARARNCQSGFNHRNHTQTDTNVSTPKRQNGKCVLGITQKGTLKHNKNTKNPFPTLSSMT